MRSTLTSRQTSKRDMPTCRQEAAAIAETLRKQKLSKGVAPASTPDDPDKPDCHDPYAPDPTDTTSPEKGALADVALKVIMKCMWVARYARRDLGRAVGHLATKVSRWTPLEDKKLHRLISYMHHSRDVRQVGFIGDPVEELRLGLFTDADFAGDKATMKSTSGVFLALYGPNSFFPLDYLSRMQKCATLSTTEAETIAAVLGLKTVGIPALELWSVILKRDVVLDLFQDNQSTMCVLLTGKSPQLRHMKRTQGYSLSWAHQQVTAPYVNLCDCVTDMHGSRHFHQTFRHPTQVGACLQPYRHRQAQNLVKTTPQYGVSLRCQNTQGQTGHVCGTNRTAPTLARTRESRGEIMHPQGGANQQHQHSSPHR